MFSERRLLHEKVNQFNRIAVKELCVIIVMKVVWISHTIVTHISNNPSFRRKHPGVPDGYDGSDGTSNPLTENYTLPVAQATGRVAYSPPLLCARYTHHQNDTCVTLFTGAADML
jgi:hypothetical protein